VQRQTSDIVDRGASGKIPDVTVTLLESVVLDGTAEEYVGVARVTVCGLG